MQVQNKFLRGGILRNYKVFSFRTISKFYNAWNKNRKNLSVLNLIKEIF